MKECSLQSSLNSKEVSDPTKYEPRAVTLVGCCNGIVCCYDPRDRRFLLWNPAIRVSIELPYSGGRSIAKRGFGWDESNGAYKVFAVLNDLKSNRPIGRVYSSNTNSWRTMPCGSLSVFNVDGLFIRGNLHWVDWRHSQIECFDLEREEFGRIVLPFKNAIKLTSYHSLLLGEIGGSLSILIDWKKNLEVWGMMEYGVKDSWFKLLTFPHIALPRPCTFVSCYPLFGEGSDGEIFVCDGNNLIVTLPKKVFSLQPPIMSASSWLVSTLKV